MSTQRIDYYDSPEAPKANSLVPSVNVVVVNDAGEILLIRRTDNGNWALPGGAIDLGESVAQAAVRETLEESGIQCAITGIAGIYSDPKHVILYTSNGEALQEFSIVLTAPATGRTADAQQRVKRGPLGPGIRTPQLHDGPVHAPPHQRLPGTQRVPGDYLIPRDGGQRRSSRAADTGPGNARADRRRAVKGQKLVT
jgi:ADP-ribose pyrophosphatase YjhB (NUDIX family)